MTIDPRAIQIIETAIKDIPFDGWEWFVFEHAAKACNIPHEILSELFPKGLEDTLILFSDWADQKMLIALEDVDTQDMRIRDRISIAVQKRITFLTPYKECVNQGRKILSRPQFVYLGSKITWRAADVIWAWAGDTSTDYNYYTKRTLLGGVITSTMLYWVQDTTQDNQKTFDFLNRRIDNVLCLGKNISPFIKPIANIAERFIVRKKQEN